MVRKASRFVLVPMIKISPGMVLTYNILDPPPPRDSNHCQRYSYGTPEAKQYTGILSPSAKKRLIRAINLLVAIAKPKTAIHFKTSNSFKFRVNFITLTLPAPQGEVTDADLKNKCLKRWVEGWRDKSPGLSYVWRAERQENGNLHFHLMTDTYRHHREIRDSWNKTLEQFHFIQAFEQSHGHRFPNSTDVHAVRSLRTLGAYIAKYMSKDEKTAQTVTGKIWDCSANLKRKDKCDFVPTSDELTYFGKLYDSLPGFAFSTEHCAGVKMTEAEMHRLLPEGWKSLYSSYLNRVRYAHQLPPIPANVEN